MRIFFRYYSWIFICGTAFAQPRLYNLTNDVQRYSTQKPVTSQSLRLESRADTVAPKATIRIIEGYNPRCMGENTLNLKFSATGINLGEPATVEWLVNGTLAATGNVFESSTLQNSTTVQARVTSTLACAVPKTVLSNSITIEYLSEISPQITISALPGGNPACNASDTLHLVANVTNGGTSPFIEWYKNDTLQAGNNSSVFTISPLANGKFVYAKVKSSLTCATPSEVQSNIIVRNIARTLPPSVLMQLLEVTNPDCGSRQFTFLAIPTNGGTTPIYDWWLNNRVVQSGTSPTFTTPLPTNGDEVKVQLRSSLNCATQVPAISAVYQRLDTLTLPFFDDFSTYTGQPDKNRWVKNEGTYINNSFPIRPPSYNAATFDGLDYKASAYDTLIPTTRGITDRLTSLPINLSTINETQKDSVFLSFFWQMKGRGETPEALQGDALELYFKDNTQNWVRVWQVNSSPGIDFNYTIIKIPNLTANPYFHNSFQFRFQSIGRQSGMFDVWNVDYIYLNKNRNATDDSFADITISEGPVSLLTPYTSVPIEHFLSHKNELIIATVTSLLNNLNKTGFYTSANRWTLESNTNTSFTADLPPQVVGVNELYKPIVSPVFLNNISVPNQKQEIKYRIAVSGDQDFIDNKSIPYTQNNTFTGSLILDNFYAYDDGSAEYGIGLNQKFGFLAYEFDILEPDTLKQIAISFLQLGRVLINQSVNLFASTRLLRAADFAAPTPPRELLFLKNVPVVYAKPQNNWVVYSLDEPVAVPKGKIYIGFRQIIDDAAVVGWDVNTNSAHKIYFNIGAQNATNGWEPYTDTTGSMLMRPVFGQYNYVISSDKSITANNAELTVFPNPVNTVLTMNILAGTAVVKNVSGQTLIICHGCQQIDFSSLPSGFYFLYVEQNGHRLIKKVVKN